LNAETGTLRLFRKIVSRNRAQQLALFAKDEVFSQRTEIKWMDGVPRLKAQDLPVFMGVVNRNPQSLQLTPISKVQELKNMSDKELPKDKYAYFWAWNFKSDGSVHADHKLFATTPLDNEDAGLFIANHVSSVPP
jgi:hypothetical protein